MIYINKQKVLIIGLDGGTWALIEPWADGGELPTFKKLMENGSWGICLDIKLEHSIGLI